MNKMGSFSNAGYLILNLNHDFCDSKVLTMPEYHLTSENFLNFISVFYYRPSETNIAKTY